MSTTASPSGTRLQSVVRSEGMTAIISTHDASLQAMADRTLRLADGALVADEAR